MKKIQEMRDKLRSVVHHIGVLAAYDVKTDSPAINERTAVEMKRHREAALSLVHDVETILTYNAEGDPEYAAIRAVQVEFRKANEHHRPHANPHETYGILAEELAEFFDEVRKKEEMRSKLAMRKELAQVAAAAIRGMLALDMPTERTTKGSLRDDPGTYVPVISNPVTPGSLFDEAINGRRQHFVEVQLAEPVVHTPIVPHVVEGIVRQPTTTRVVVDVDEVVRLEVVHREGDREQVRTFDAFMYSFDQTRDRVDVSYGLQPKPTFREVRTERGDIFRVGVAQPAPLSMDGEDMMPTEGDPL